MTAISLYFSEGDPVSIHALTAAAYEIVFSLAKQKGIDDKMIRQSDFSSKDSKKTYEEALREAQNHLKHADRDPEAIKDFNTNLTEFFLYDACVTYMNLTHEEVPEFSLFTMWFVFKNDGKIFDLPTDKFKGMEKYKNDRAAFFRDYLPLLKENR